MYKVPADFDVNGFVGAVLEMVCFTANQIMFEFTDKKSIVAEGAVEIAWKGGRPQLITSPVSDSNLMMLLEHHVVSVAVENNEIITLVFDTGDRIRLSDVADNYESYHLTIGEHEVTL